MTSNPRVLDAQTTRRTFLAMCLATAGAAALSPVLRLQALRAYAALSWPGFTAHEHAVLIAAANTVAPGGTVQTRVGSRTVPSAGDAGTVNFIANLLSGSLIYAAGTRRPPYVTLPSGATAAIFPSIGQVPLWTVKQIGWYGGGPHNWPSELQRLQLLYSTGVTDLDTAAQSYGHPGYDQAPSGPAGVQPGGQEWILRQRQQQEVNQFNANPASTDPYQGAEWHQPFFLTFLDDVCQALFGDPIYRLDWTQGTPDLSQLDYRYWDMINFSGPSYTNGAGPSAGHGWNWSDMTAPFDRSKPAAVFPPPPG